MKFSIITVTFNCCTSIEKTIQSVKAQTYIDKEYILIDGNSTDGTKEIIECYSDDITFFLSEPDNGIYEAMNKGLRVASGDYVIFMNGDDDFVDENALLRITPYCKGDNIVIGREYCGSRLSDVVDFSKQKSKYYGIFYPHQATFIPLKLFKEYGLYDESYRISADFEWICRAMHAGVNVDWVDEMVSHFNLGGISSYLRCCEEEYLISKKYMQLSHEDELIPDMVEKSKKKARNAIFRTIIANKSVKNDVEKVIRKYIDSSEHVRIWGAGILAVPYTKMFREIGIKVDCIIDKNSSGLKLSGIPVVSYNENLIKDLFISTADYDDEITCFLVDNGFIEGKDFISCNRLMDDLLSEVGECDKLIHEFKEKTGLSINKK